MTQTKTETQGSRERRCAANVNTSRGQGHNYAGRILLAVAAMVLCSTLSTTTRTFATAFVPQSSLQAPSKQQLRAKPPSIDEWEVLRSGAIKGTIKYHPELPVGYEITTSPIDNDTSALKDNMVVVTVSGSKYKLLTKLPVKEKPQKPSLNLFGKKGNDKKPAAAAKSKKKTPPKPSKGTASLKIKQQPKASQGTASLKIQKPPPRTINYDLNGKVVGSGNDQYLLSGKLIRSSSKRSQIYYAYKANKKDPTEPSGARLIIKLTESEERLGRENKNYNRVFSQGRVLFSPLGGASSCYMKKVGFLPRPDDSPATQGIPRGLSALVLESGDQNLRTFLSDTRGGLSGSDLRKTAVNICRCIEAMHSSGLVWTDLKAENFVLVSGANSDVGEYMVKGIDLESAVVEGTSPEDYSPEACPPEFAAAEKQGVGYEFKVRKNYDTWSLGMLLYELAVGRNYFRGKSEGAILNTLAQSSSQIVDPENPSTVAGLDAIEDQKYRDLVSQCLSINPKKRPSILQILFHPYFLTTGFGPISY